MFVVGGGEIYKQFIDLVNKIFLTKVDVECDADTMFPEIDEEKWEKISEEKFKKDDKNEFDYSFISYSKKAPKI